MKQVSPAENEAVLPERHGQILVLVLEPSAEHLESATVRRNLCATLERAAAEPTIAAILLIISGIDTDGELPAWSAVCHRIEQCAKPVVAALHGATLDGALEIALAAHYRLAVPSACFGLPTIRLGLPPGMGGTQRLPRLIGMQAALDLLVSGRLVDAQEAQALGLIDTLAPENNVRAASLLYTRELLAGNAPVRRTRDARALADHATAQAALDNARRALIKTAPGLLAPTTIIEAAEAALTQPFDIALQLEHTLFLQCAASPQHAGLVHAAFAEHETVHAPAARAATPRPIAQLGVIGGGTMGAGIAVAALDAGLPVVMIERDATTLARGRAQVEAIYHGRVAKGRLAAALQAERLARFTGDTDYAALAHADLVIEAVFEEMAIKQHVFAELTRVCKPGAVLATNTSYLDIDALAASTTRAADVIGLHFFSPAYLMKLLEIVVPAQAGDEVVATAFALASKLRKIPVRAGVCDGFIGNRILAACRTAADQMIEDGASPYQIDQALRGFGFPMGPFQVIDLAGGDIGWAARKRRAPTRDPRARYVEIADRLCERGWFGQKTGRGYYRYPDGARSGTPDPEVIALIEAERRRAGVTPRTFSNDDIVRRYLAAQINAGADVVYERIALRPLDVDIVLLHGYGFPRYRGGPMKYADTIGIARVLADIRAFAQHDPLFWTPSPLLIELDARGVDFASLDRPA